MSKLRFHLTQFLARREYSEAELRQKMTTKKYPIEAIDHELSLLQAQGLQSDLRFTQSMCSHYAGRGKGPHYVLMHLKLKGVDKALAQDTVANFNWTDALLIAKRKLVSVSGEKLKQRLYARGFTQNNIQQGLDQEVENEY
ncbi:recombination regulator RecX [Gammaproteobacteria bacterium]|nr:recombination regulator RecX [Gammaproteobacteria bacterium]